MIVVNTTKQNNINEIELQEVISKTASLIRYEGRDYLDKIKQINSQYEIKNQRFLTERELIMNNPIPKNNN